MWLNNNLTNNIAARRAVVGTEWSSRAAQGFGWVTTNATQLVFCMPVTLANAISSFTPTEIKMQIRPAVNDYIGGSLNALLPISEIISVQVTSMGLQIIALRDNGWGVANNSIVVGQMMISGTFS